MGKQRAKKPSKPKAVKLKAKPKPKPKAQPEPKPQPQAKPTAKAKPQRKVAVQPKAKPQPKGKPHCDEHGRLYECDEDGWPLEPLQYKAHMPPATPTSPGVLLLSPELIKAATDAFTAASPGAAPAPACGRMRQLPVHQGPQHTTCHCCLHPAAIQALIQASAGAP
jgi:outer membrane biosynthesis protein TonB